MALESRILRLALASGLLVLLSFGSATPSSAQQQCPPEGCVPGAGASPDTTVPSNTVPTTAPAGGATTVPTAPTGGQASNSTAQVNPSTVVAGESVTVQGSGFAPNQALQITFGSPPTSVGSTSSDASGSYQTTVTVPATATLGAHQLVVAGPGAEGGPQESVGTVNVGLAQTGVMTDVLAVLGLVALVVGLVLVRRSEWTRPVSTLNWAGSRRR